MRASATQQVLISYSGTANKCANVTFDPIGGIYDSTPMSILLSTTTAGAHIFYTTSIDTPVTPTHSGDNATGSTLRIGSNSGSISISISANHSKEVSALAYKSGLADSDVTGDAYIKSGGP